MRAGSIRFREVIVNIFVNNFIVFISAAKPYSPETLKI